MNKVVKRMQDFRSIRMYIRLISLTIVLGLTGCGSSQPKPHILKMQEIKNDLTPHARTIILNKMIREISRETRSGATRHGCIVTWESGYQDKDCYVLKGNNIERVSEIYGIGRIHKKSLIHIEGILQHRFETKLMQYEKYVNDFKKGEEGVKLKLSTMKVSLIDSTGILPNDSIEKLNKISIRRYPASAGHPFSNYRDNIKIDNLFTIETMAYYNETDRYKVEFSKDKFLEMYKIVPADRKIKIKRVKYNYLPSTYIASDKNIEVVVKNNILGKNSILSIVVENNTKEFVELNTISGYYGGDVIINILHNRTDKIQIPPRSSITLALTQNGNHLIDDFPVQKYLYTTDRKQKISYGFSVGYTMVNQNANKNIYKVTDYTINNIESK